MASPWVGDWFHQFSVCMCSGPSIPDPGLPVIQVSQPPGLGSGSSLSWRKVSLSLWWILTCLDLLPPRSLQTQSSEQPVPLWGSASLGRGSRAMTTACPQNCS